MDSPFFHLPHPHTNPATMMNLFLFDFTLSTFFLLAGFFYSKSSSTLPPKRVAWILTAWTSMTLASLSMTHVYKLYLHDWDLSTLIFTDDRLSRFTVTFFLTFLLLDLLLGSLYYPAYIHPLSGWTHHLVYICVLLWALRDEFTLGFCLFLPMELPTWILAIGSIYPQRRSDLLFGLTFFFTRICYHALLMQLVVGIKEAEHCVWPVVVAAGLLHCYWFYGWCVSYQARLSKGMKEGRNGEKVHTHTHTQTPKETQTQSGGGGLGMSGDKTQTQTHTHTHSVSKGMEEAWTYLKGALVAVPAAGGEGGGGGGGGGGGRVRGRGSVDEDAKVQQLLGLGLGEATRRRAGSKVA